MKWLLLLVSKLQMKYWLMHSTVRSMIGARSECEPKPSHWQLAMNSIQCLAWSKVDTVTGKARECRGRFLAFGKLQWREREEVKTAANVSPARTMQSLCVLLCFVSPTST